MSYPSVSFLPTTPSMGLQPIAQASTTQQHPLGYIIQAADVTYGQGEFIYLIGVASTAAGDPVAYNSKTGATARVIHAGATSTGPVGVAMSACIAGLYGWYQISGAGPVNTGSNTVAANVALYLTSTASELDDAVVAGDEVVGLTSKAANSGGFTTAQLERPSIPSLGGSSGSNTGDVTLAAIGSSANANGASLSGQVLTLQPASASFGGILTAGTQSIAGLKSFSTGVNTNALVQAQPTSLGSGTGITSVFSGQPSTGWSCITIDKTAWTTAGLTQDITVCVIPSGARILAVYADTTTKYAGLAGTIAITMGTSAGGTDILVSKDVKTAIFTQGLLDADLGTGMVRSAMVQGAFMPSWTAPSTLSIRLTSGTGNIGTGAATNLTTGVTSVWVLLTI